MVGWLEVVAFLKAELISKMVDRKKGELWLDSLEDSTSGLGKVLGINLYIDLKCGYLKRSKIVELLNQMPESIADGRKSFWEVILDNQDKYLCIGSCEVESLKLTDRYMRVMPLYKFFSRFVRPSLNIPPTDENRKEVLRNFFEKPKDKRTKLGCITVSWKGRTDNVWIASLDEFRERTDTLNETGKANFGDDVLGLGVGQNKLIVCILYPVGFHAVAFVKPTTLDAHYETCAFFLSVKSSDGWGKTWGLSGVNGLGERVHKIMKGLSDDFQGEIIGKTSKDTDPNHDSLLNEALKRASLL